MTITEQLQFSVLTAPVAALDRRTLSQAWYSALYGASSNTAAKPHEVHAACERVTGGAAATHGNAHNAAVIAKMRGMSVHQPAPKTQAPQGMPIDRRAPRSKLARNIERVLLRPRGCAHKTAFTVESEHGRVRVLLQSRGAQLNLVAICAPGARAHVAVALAQARYALALRGIDLQSDARVAQPC